MMRYYCEVYMKKRFPHDGGKEQDFSVSRSAVPLCRRPLFDEFLSFLPSMLALARVSRCCCVLLWKVMSEAMKEEAKERFVRGDYMGAAKVTCLSLFTFDRTYHGAPSLPPRKKSMMTHSTLPLLSATSRTCRSVAQFLTTSSEDAETGSDIDSGFRLRRTRGPITVERPHCRPITVGRPRCGPIAVETVGSGCACGMYVMSHSAVNGVILALSSP